MGWWSDLEIVGGALRSKRSGGAIPVDRRLLVDVVVWLGFDLIVQARGRVARLRPGPRVWFAPQRPAPWYLVRVAGEWAGVRLAREPAHADFAFSFEDTAEGLAPRACGLPVLNGGCTDTRKSRVAAVWADVAGYALSVDPLSWTGPAVEKSERNGTHDGRVVACPTPPRPGMTYQRLVDTVEDGAAVDLRTPCVDGRPVVVWRKRRPVESRFDIYNTSVEALAPEAAYSADELELLGRFCRAFALDWGGLDVLRDVSDGRLYVVDVNTTDVGPVMALPLRDKLAGTAALGRALRAMLEARARRR